jgi:hypothetical protein
MSGSKERSIPKLEHKLSGQYNYAAWILSIEMCLTIHDIGKTGYTVWDIVTGKLQQPKDKKEEKDDKVTLDTIKLSKNEWAKANYFALLTMKKNCDEESFTKFKLARKAYDAYRALKSHYEGKTVIDLGAVLANVIRITYDDRQDTIDEHITKYKKKWGFMRSTLNSGKIPKHLNTFSQHLKGISESDIAKAEFLLLTLPPYYNTLVKNLCTKEKYNYGDIVGSLKLYVPGRQKNKKGGKMTKSEPGTSDNPIVLKTDTRRKDNKTCRYCKEEKGWGGIGHTEDKCFTKKQDLEKDHKEEAKYTDIEREGP